MRWFIHSKMLPMHFKGSNNNPIASYSRQFQRLQFICYLFGQNWDYFFRKTVWCSFLKNRQDLLLSLLCTLLKFIYVILPNRELLRLNKILICLIVMNSWSLNSSDYFLKIITTFIEYDVPFLEDFLNKSYRLIY